MIEHMDLEKAKALGNRLLAGEKAWLFLDYDGTLAEFEPTPETISPDNQLIELIERLSKHGQVLRLAILSGRKISQIKQLIPVTGVLMAGTYGIEYQTWEGEEVWLVDMQLVRPYLDRVKSVWKEMIAGKTGFYLEDKGYSLALHAKNARLEEGQELLVNADRAVRQLGAMGSFQIQGSSKFLELAPEIADKGTALKMLVEQYFWPGAEVIFIGDDDKDEAAFAAVRQMGGTPIIVTKTPRESQAIYRFLSPEEVRAWLSLLADTLEQRSDSG